MLQFKTRRVVESRARLQVVRLIAQAAAHSFPLPNQLRRNLRRDSELWRYVSRMELPETLAFRLELWRCHGVLHEYDEEGFDATSWLAIHAGMANWSEREDPVFTEISPDRALQAQQGRRQAVAAAVQRECRCMLNC